MPIPRLDCGCPAQAAYTIHRRGTTLTMCAHHGKASAKAAAEQGFTVIRHKVETPA